MGRSNVELLGFVILGLYHVLVTPTSGHRRSIYIAQKTFGLVKRWSVVDLFGYSPEAGCQSTSNTPINWSEKMGE